MPFWKYVLSRLKSRVDIPTITLPNKEKAVTALEKVEALNTYFSSIIPPMNNNYGAQISTIEFTPEIVKEEILSLNENKSPGPDNIHPFFVKSLAHVLCISIAMLFKLSMRSGTNAEQWREAIITVNHNLVNRIVFP